MRVILIWVAIAAFTLNKTNAQTSKILPVESIHYGADAERIISGANIVRLYTYTSIPAYIKLSSNSIPEDHSKSWIESIFKMGPDHDLKLISKETDELGFIHYRYIQTFRGYEIFGTGYVLHCKDGYLISANGQLYDISQLNGKKIEESKAFSLAISKMGASTYKWEIPEEEAHAKHQFEVDKIRKTPSYFPKAEFKIVPKNGNFYSKDRELRLAYVFDIYAHEPMDRKEIFVDAENGEILFENPLIKHGNANGTAITAYSGTRSIITDSVTTDSFRLRETGRGNGIRTFNLKKGTNYGAAVDFRDSNNVWNNVNANQDQYATDAHWGTEMTYDYYSSKHGRNSIDNAGFMLQSYIHYSTNYTNAFWNSSFMTYGDGASPYTPLVAMDIAGHEITHGLTERTSGLVYSYESGALNESFSDIFGVAIDFYSRPTLANWQMGDGIGSTPFRNMANPNQYGDPDTYLGTSWYAGTADNGGVHTNSGVQNYWFYLLTNGGIGRNDKNDSFWVNRLGIDTAGKITYRNNTYYLTPTSQYADARFYAIQSAIDLYGACSKAVISTTNAWHAVGVGSRFDSSVRASFTADKPITCAAPQNIKFSNTSKNASTFRWFFGDGDTSVALNPSHRYLANGYYSVTLIANGGPCGIDTFVRSNYVFIDAHNDCVFSMGDTNMTSACHGILYDHAGPQFNYSNNRSDTIRISPTGASAISFKFIDFEVEPGTSGTTCDYDFVQLHNGTSVAASSLGKYCNNNLPPSAGITSGASGTVRFLSDGGLTMRGFELKWQCTTSNAKPAVRFSASALQSCTGQIQFKDESYNSPTSWSWSFGDGGTSTLQNPSYVYNTSGTYSVRLIATNSFGSDTFTKLSYVTINRPPSPIANSQRRCGNGSLSLTASGSGTIQWFDSVNSTTVLSTGSTYSTPSLSATRAYYVHSVSANSTFKVGPVDTTIGAGGNHTGTPSAYMIFDCYRPCKLNSVKVRANGTRNRRIQLINRLGTVLKDTIISIPSGTQVVQLGFDLPMGNDLRLAIHKDSVSNLYRSTSGTTYPYTDASGLISIKGHSYSSSSPSNYYYFYDWTVQEAACTSPRVMVSAKIQQPITLKNLDTFNCNGATIDLTPSGNDIDSIYWTTGSVATSSRIVNPTTNTDYIYTAFNACGAYRDTANIAAQATPTLIASNDTTICAGQSLKLKAQSNYTPTWIGQSVTDTVLNISPTVTTSYFVQVSNLCGVKRDTIVVTVVNQPSLTAQNDTTICSANGALLTASSALPITWFPMNSNGTSVNVNPSSSTYYYAQVSNLCGTIRDTVNVNVINPLILTASHDTTICNGQSVKLKAISALTPTWTNLSITDTMVTVSPSTSTNYVVQVSNLCGVKRDTIAVTVVNQPTLTAQNDTTICSTNGTILTASSSLPIIWFPMNSNGSTVTVNPSNSALYYAQVSNICGTKRDTVNVNVINPLNLTSSHDTTICTGQSVKLKAISALTPTWTNLSITDSMVTVSPSTSTNYVVQVSNLCGVKRDTIAVTVVNQPSLTAQNDTTVCIGNSVSIQANSSLPITWTPGNIVSNAITITPTSNISYFAQVSNICGTQRDTVNIAITNNATLTVSNDTAICSGQTAHLKARSNGVIYWSSLSISDSNVSVNPIINTLYPILVTTPCGIARDTISVSILPNPKVVANPDTSICMGQTLSLSASSAQTITWFPGMISGANYSITPTTSQIYYAEVSNSCGVHRDSILITVVPYPTLNKSKDTSICLNTLAVLSVKSNASIFWPNLSSTDTLVTVSPTISSAYRVIASNSCGSLSDSIQVTLIPRPSLKISNDTVVCKGSPIRLNATSNDQVTWYPNGIPNSKVFDIIPASSAFYYAVAANVCGQTRDTVHILVMPKPVLVTNHDTSVCLGKVVRLIASSNALTRWKNPDTLTSVIDVKPTKSSVYTVEASNTCGTIMDTVIVSVIPHPKSSFTKTVNASTMYVINSSTNATAFNWEFGDGDKSNLSNPIYRYKSDGLFNGMLISSNQCGLDTLKFIVNISTINTVVNISLDELKIYPNPANTSLYIDASSYLHGYKPISIQIYNSEGKKLIEDKTSLDGRKRIDVSSFANGIYTIVLSNERINKTSKIEIIH